MPTAHPHSPIPYSPAWERAYLCALILFAFALRLWNLEGRGFGYDEAATALMARATPAAIIHFHWTAAFEHLPLWVLLMRLWSQTAGQSEIALRLLPAYAGVLVIPLLWVQLRRHAPADAPLRILSAALTAIAPLLVLYSQEARMYTLVVALAMISVTLSFRLLATSALWTAAAYAFVNWTMVGLHYYSLLLIATQGMLAAALLLLAHPTAHHSLRRSSWALALASLFSTLPFVAWATYSPGFQETIEVVWQAAGDVSPSASEFLAETWRDLSIGAFRWHPAHANIGLLMLPLPIIGAWAIARNRPTRADADRKEREATAASVLLHRAWSWYLLLIVLFPLLVSLLFFRTLSTRYMLYLTPYLYLLTAAGILRLWRIARPLGIVALAAYLIVAGAGLQHFFGPYQKSYYRAMTDYLSARADPATDAALLEAPRQHLLAKYYLDPALTKFPVPNIPLPDYRPVTAPQIVPDEVDGYIQGYLRRYPTLWAIFTAEDEVDDGEFLASYLQAVAYETECGIWRDVRLCRFLSPHFVHYTAAQSDGATFNDELRLAATESAVVPGAAPGDHNAVLLRLDWEALRQPTIDYKLSLRLLEPAGSVVAQVDDFPIGPLLPPTTWQAGDQKPGYMALPIPPGQAHGDYTIALAVYDPATLTPIAPTVPGVPESAAPSSMLLLARLQIGDSLTVAPVAKTP